MRDGIPRTDRETFRPDAECGLCGLTNGFGIAFKEHTICEPCIDGAWWVATASWEEEDPCTFCGALADAGEERITVTARGAIELGAGAPAVEALVELLIDDVKSNARPALPTFAVILGTIAANRCVASKRFIARMELLMASPLAKAGRMDDARAVYERAIALYEPYADDGEGAPTRNLAAACINLAVSF